MKVTEITPETYRCLGGACPKVFETDRGTLIVVGRQISAQEAASLLGYRLAHDESVVELPKEILSGVRVRTA